MNVPSLKQKSVALHDFSMNPNSQTPRSQFNLSHGRKVPFNFSDLIPILCRFVLPGDTWNCNIHAAARTAVPIVPVQDNWHMHYYSFFVPMRLVWANAKKFFGEQTNPGDSIAFTIPQLATPNGGFPIGTLGDYFGLPGPGQVSPSSPLTVNALPFRAYYKIYDDWFRDQNLQNSLAPSTGDGPDAMATYVIKQRNKGFDYITQALPWPQKGNTAVTIPMGTSAPVRTAATHTVSGAQPQLLWKDTVAGGGTGNGLLQTRSAATEISTAAIGTVQFTVYPSNLFADLSAATASTINALRTSATLQQYLELDARGGTRYNEFVWNHYRVRTADARLQRPEFIGGGYAPINTVPIAQTSATGLTGSTTPVGTLAATGYVGGGRAGFTYSATEHGYIITLVCCTADLTYSQGINKMWSMSTRYDIPVPVLAGLGEQSLLRREVYADGTANDDLVFGYVPRFDEYRTIPSEIVGIYKPYATGNIAYWHSSQNFTTAPTLSSAFITDDAKTTVQRNFAAGATSLGQQVLADFYFDIKCARTLPVRGTPGITRL